MNSEKLLVLIADETKALLTKHKEEIEKAYGKMTGDESLSISMTHKLTPEGPKRVKVETSLSFVIDRVKDSKEYSYNESQPGLPGILDEKGKEKVIPIGTKGKKKGVKKT